MTSSGSALGDVAAIEVDRLGLRYGETEVGVSALEDCSFTARAGEFVSIVGPSGCGKTSLLRLIGGLAQPSTGRIRLFGNSPDVARRERLVGYMFQDPVLLPWLTALGNVQLPIRITGEQRRDPLQMLRLVGLDKRRGAYPAELSGGMKQRVALARSLVLNPRIWLLDEPFAKVDEMTRTVLNDELLRIWGNSEITTILVTHSLHEAVFMADRVLVFSGQPGRVLQSIDVPLERPRTQTHRRSPEFLNSVEALREQLQ